MPVSRRPPPGPHGTGVTVSLVAAPAATGQPGALAAWDASHARVVWAAAAEPADAKSGALVTAGGLILYCRADGWFTVLDVASGRELWKHQLAGGERGTPISYLGSDGHQYAGRADRAAWRQSDPAAVLAAALSIFTSRPTVRVVLVLRMVRDFG